MIFLVKDNENVRVFFSKAEMEAAGFQKANKTVSEEKFNSNGCYARLINGEIVVGKTAEEQQIEEISTQIFEIDSELEALDREFLTPRILSGLHFGDKYAIEQAKKHEEKAVPLREKRKALEKQL